MKLNRKGQISVFLCIILISSLVFTGMLVDSVRVRSADKAVRMALENACASVLAGYRSSIKEDYGLFSLKAGLQEQSILEEEIGSYLINNLEPANTLSSQKELRLYDFRVEELRVTPLDGLNKTSVTKAQILEYMKYRAPKELLAKFLQKLGVFEELGNMAEALRLKTEIDKLIGAVDKARKALKQSIDGLGDTRKLCVNSFIPKEWLDELDKYVVICRQINEAKKAEEAAAGAMGNIELSVREANELWNTIYHDMTKSLLLPNENALANAKEIVKACKSCISALEELTGFVDSRFSSTGPLSEDFISNIRQDLSLFNNLLESGEKSLSVIEQLENNIDSIRNMCVSLQKIRDLMLNGNIDRETLNSMINEISDMANNYKSISYSFSSPEKKTAGTDNRREAEEASSNSLNLFNGEDVNYEKAGISKEMLPSGEKTEGGVETGISEADYFSEELKLQKEALDLMKIFGQIAAADETDLAESLYINEYIMQTFDNEDRAGFYDGEREYILIGDASQNMNKRLVAGKIFLIRFALNTIHVYSDSAKKELAAGTAALVAGWWTGGAGIPILANLIMCGWGAAEAALDLSELMDGGEVALFKGQADWKLDVGMTLKPVPTNKINIRFSYDDYIRLLLLLVGEETKLLRLEDLIQINMMQQNEGFKLEDSKTALKAEAEVSVNRLFFGQRKKIRCCVYEKY